MPSACSSPGAILAPLLRFSGGRLRKPATEGSPEAGPPGTTPLTRQLQAFRQTFFQAAALAAAAKRSLPPVHGGPAQSTTHAHPGTVYQPARQPQPQPAVQAGVRLRPASAAPWAMNRQWLDGAQLAVAVSVPVRLMEPLAFHHLDQALHGAPPGRLGHPTAGSFPGSAAARARPGMPDFQLLAGHKVRWKVAHLAQGHFPRAGVGSAICSSVPSGLTKHLAKRYQAN